MKFNPFLLSTYPNKTDLVPLASTSNFYGVDWKTIYFKELYSKVRLPTMLRPVWVNHAMALWTAIHSYICFSIEKHPDTIINSDILEYGPVQVFADFDVVKAILIESEKSDDANFIAACKPFHLYFKMISFSKAENGISDIDAEKYQEFSAYHQDIFSKVIESAQVR